MKKIAIIFILLLAVVFAFSIFFFNPKRLTPEDPYGKAVYYTIIENKNVIINNDNRHEYTLTSYDKKGNKKELNFTSSKQLREGGYLELYVTLLRGVTYWQEIQYNELPDVVKEIYKR